MLQGSSVTHQLSSTTKHPDLAGPSRKNYTSWSVCILRSAEALHVRRPCRRRVSTHVHSTVLASHAAQSLVFICNAHNTRLPLSTPNWCQPICKMPRLQQPAFPNLHSLNTAGKQAACVTCICREGLYTQKHNVIISYISSVCAVAINLCCLLSWNTRPSKCTTE